MRTQNAKLLLYLIWKPLFFMNFLGVFKFSTKYIFYQFQTGFILKGKPPLMPLIIDKSASKKKPQVFTVKIMYVVFNTVHIQI